jgi:hypothetical protein
MVLYCKAIACLVDLQAILDGVVAMWIKLCPTAEGRLLNLAVADQVVEPLAEVVKDL